MPMVRGVAAVPVPRCTQGRPAAKGWDSHRQVAGCGEEDVDSIQSQSPEHSSRGMTKLVASAPWAVRPAAKS